MGVALSGANPELADRLFLRNSRKNGAPRAAFPPAEFLSVWRRGKTRRFALH